MTDATVPAMKAPAAARPADATAAQAGASGGKFAPCLEVALLSTPQAAPAGLAAQPGKVAAESEAAPPSAGPVAPGSVAPGLVASVAAAPVMPGAIPVPPGTSVAAPPQSAEPRAAATPARREPTPDHKAATPDQPGLAIAAFSGEVPLPAPPPSQPPPPPMQVTGRETVHQPPLAGPAAPVGAANRTASMPTEQRSGTEDGPPAKVLPVAPEAIQVLPPSSIVPEAAKAEPSAAIAAASALQAASAPATTARAMTDAPAPAPGHAAPAAQIAPALVSLGTGAAAGRLTVRLEPAGTGQVRIQIDRPHDGAARVQVTVERPETMTLLMRDAPSLQRTLDQAGVPADGRTLTFHLVPQEAAPASPSSGHGGGSALASGGPSGDGPGARSFGEPGNGGSRTRGGVPWLDHDSAGSSHAARWITAALDITA